MKTTATAATSSPHDIVEKLLLLILILIAIVLSYFGGEVFKHLASSVRWERIVAIPGLDGSLILGPAARSGPPVAFPYWPDHHLFPAPRPALEKRW